MRSVYSDDSHIPNANPDLGQHHRAIMNNEPCCIRKTGDVKAIDFVITAIGG